MGEPSSAWQVPLGFSGQYGSDGTVVVGAVVVKSLLATHSHWTNREFEYWEQTSVKSEAISNVGLPSI